MIDEWSSLADLLAALIEKYASSLDIENLPVPEEKEGPGSVPDSGPSFVEKGKTA